MKIERIGVGQHPSEIIGGVCRADDGTEKVIVDRHSLDGDTLEVGFPVGWSGENLLLIKLLRESTRGWWRVWVKAEDVLDWQAAA